MKSIRIILGALIISSSMMYSQTFIESDTLIYSYLHYSQEYEDSLRGKNYFIGFSYNYPKIQNNESIMDTVIKFIFEKNEVPKNIPEYLNNIISRYKEYLESKANYVVSLMEERDVKIIYNRNNISTLSLKEYYYNGGMHGQTLNYFKSFRIDSSDQIKLSDLFQKNFYSELTKIAKEEFFSQLKLDKNKSLKEQYFWFKEDEFYLNNNFYINSDGLHFYYNNYEIRAYGFGPTDLLIPWSKISSLLKEKIGI